MQIHRYQIYLLLFFVFFLLTDISLICIANKTYGNSMLLGFSKKIYAKTGLTKNRINDALSNDFEINIHSTDVIDQYLIDIKPTKSIASAQLSIQIMDMNNKVDVKILKLNYPYTLTLNLSAHSRKTLKIHAKDETGNDYHASFRLFCNHGKYALTQLS